MNKNSNSISNTKNLVLTALMAAIMCILGPLSVPLPVTLVPISLTNFIIYLTAFVLTWKFACLSYIVYLLIGIAGVPVFSNFGSGIGKVAGPTGGYLVAFLITAFLCSYINEKFSGKVYVYVAGMVVGLFIDYFFGTLWFVYQQNIPFKKAVMLCIVPFLIGDAIKIIVATIIGPVLKKAVKKIRN